MKMCNQAARSRVINSMAHSISGVFLTLLFLITFDSYASSSSSSETMPQTQQEFAAKSAQFATQMLDQLVKEKPSDNIIFSPFSIQTCVGMARIGATKQTAEQLDFGLGLPKGGDLSAIGNTFHEILARYENSSILKIANKIYVMQGITIKQAFNDILTKQFFSTAENIDFSTGAAAANTINKWVESKTNKLIKDLIPASAVNSDTRLVLLNAIHFKGEWVHQFPKHATHDDDFYLNENDKVQVPMMNLKETFRYGEFPELDATALEMSYKDTDLSMLVILPNSRTGLKALQEKLQNHALSDITKKMHPQKVIVKFPKFKAEFTIELNRALKNLGMGRMFSNQAEFDNMLQTNEELQVSKVLHKAFIEVNEEGTEAAAATGAVVRKKRSAVFLAPMPEFIAEHPFVYYLLHKSSNTESADANASAHSSLALFMGVTKTLTAAPGAAAARHSEL